MIRRLLTARRCSVLLLYGCGTTVDPVGYNEATGFGGADGVSGAGAASGGVSGAGGAGAASGAGGETAARRLRPLRGPSSYPNAFRDLLGKTEAQITARIDEAFEQLFHGNPSTEAIYFEKGDGAYIRDILHDDIRTEGMGLGMMITLQLNRREEFDRLWRYSRDQLQFMSGENRGYFRSRCDTLDGDTIECIDPYGLQQFVMALVLAHGRWGSSGQIDYESAAFSLFDVMRNKEAENGGIKAGVTNTFDAQTNLVFDVPHESAASFTRPSVIMPAYYELWALATGESFYGDAAVSGRSYWRLVANPTTGLMPTRASLKGQPLDDWNTFSSSGFRTHFNLVLDAIWTTSDPWVIQQSDRTLAFFADEGIDSYGSSYTLDGMRLRPDRDQALIVSNGALALISQHEERSAFVERVWEQPVVMFEPRYYAGVLHLLSLTLLGGRFRVY